MEVRITGLTESTITFNEIDMSSGSKLIMHGQETATVNLDNPAKLNEVSVLEDCNLIKCVETNKEEKCDDCKDCQHTEAKVAPDKADEDIEDKPAETPPPVAPEPVVEAQPETPAPTEDTEDTEDKAEKRGRGRPKGSKNKKAGSIKRVDNKEKSEEKSDDNRVIVVSETGKPVEASTTTEDDKDSAEESESTRASIEAMKKIEKEENEAKEAEKLDEKTEDVNNQMGSKATVYTGEGASKVEMKNSMVPDSDVAKEADPFIDKEDSAAKAEVDAETNSFLDGLTDEDDSFIEI